MTKAPQIAGHRHLRLISAAGGYGDVHLYEETELGNRRVAVKVIRDAGLGSDAVHHFLLEAQTMAALEHPNIVRVYGAGSTADGRPYISMQYCPDDTLETRVQRERLSVAEVLRTGIGIGSAIETAHRAGLLHRDIKPANILKTQWGAPGLTDFGVAHQMSAEDSGGADVGVSVPWSPPEMLYTTTNGSPASDVYSLAATIWHLLVGRPPFELLDGDNGVLATMSRIRDLPAPATGRADVPESLERVLRQAMAKRPEQRPRTMAEFIRNLQSVEAELRLPVTEAVVIDPHSRIAELPAELGLGRSPGAVPTGVNDGVSGGSGVAGTVIRARMAGSPAHSGSDTRPADGLANQHTQLRRPSAAVTADGVRSPSAAQAGTVIRPQVTQVDVPSGGDPVASGRTKGVLVGAGVVLLIAAVVVGLVLTRTGRPSDSGPTPRAAATKDTGGGEDSLPPGPVKIIGQRGTGQVTFTWEYSARLPNDEYRWQLVGGSSGVAKTPTLTLPVGSDAKLCLQVMVVRADGSNAAKDWSEQGCA